MCHMNQRKRESILVILGAGASWPIAPTTEELTQKLAEWEYSWSPGVKPFGSFAVPSGGQKPNFEDFIGALDEIRMRYSAKDSASYDLSLALVEQWHPLNDPVIPLAGAQELNRQAFTELTLLPHEARVQVLSEIKKRIDTWTMDVLREAPINRLLRHLSEQFQCAVISLNYDPILDYSGLQLHHGFTDKDPTDTSYQLFNPRWEVTATGQPLSDNETLFIPLHGSVHFGMRPKDAPPLLGIADPVWYEDINTAANTWSPASQGITRNDDVDILMVSGRHKAQTLMALPYAAYMAIFRRLTLTRNKWLIIGYGGQDYHVNAVLKQAILSQVVAGRQPSMVLVDKKDNRKSLNDLVRRIGLFDHVIQLRAPQYDHGSWFPVIDGCAHIGWANADGVASAAENVNTLVDYLKY